MDFRGRFWAGVFSEPDGTPSFSRVATGMTLSFALGWVTHLVWHNHALPDFAGLVAFIGVLYGINKAGAAGAALNRTVEGAAKPNGSKNG